MIITKMAIKKYIASPAPPIIYGDSKNNSGCYL